MHRLLLILGLLVCAVSISAQTVNVSTPVIVGNNDTLDNLFGYSNSNSFDVLKLTSGTATMGASSSNPAINMQIHSRPNGTAGTSGFDVGIFGYHHGTNATNDGNIWAKTTLAVGRACDSTATPQASLYYDCIGMQSVAVARPGSKAAAFGANLYGILMTPNGFANGVEVNVLNASGQAAPALSWTSAVPGTSKGLAIVGYASGTGSSGNSAALTIQASAGGAFKTGVSVGPSAVTEIAFDLAFVGTAIPIRLGSDSSIYSRNAAGSANWQVVGLNEYDQVALGQDGQAVQVGSLNSTDVNGAQFSVSAPSSTDACMAVRRDFNAWWTWCTQGASSMFRSNITNNILFMASGGNVGIGNSAPGAKFQVTGGDAAISTQGNGLILRATTGSSCYLVTVNSVGVLITTSVSCP